MVAPQVKNLRRIDIDFNISPEFLSRARSPRARKSGHERDFPVYVHQYHLRTGKMALRGSVAFPAAAEIEDLWHSMPGQRMSRYAGSQRRINVEFLCASRII